MTRLCGEAQFTFFTIIKGGEAISGLRPIRGESRGSPSRDIGRASDSMRDNSKRKKFYWTGQSIMAIVHTKEYRGIIKGRKENEGK